MPLIVCSKSTLKYAKEMEGRVYQITHPPDRETLDIIVVEDEIIAIGGGSVIDTAKIMGAQSGINTILAYPTTGAGASSTSHAVYWDKGRKCVIDTPKPITLFDINFVEGIPNHIWAASRHDAISHARESIASIHRTAVSMRLANAALSETIGCSHKLSNVFICGILAGQAIEITGTNVIHALSYPLTGHYGIPHGQAVGIMTRGGEDGVIVEVPDREYDIDLLVSEALSYPQIHDTSFVAAHENVRDLYKEALCL